MKSTRLQRVRPLFETVSEKQTVIYPDVETFATPATTIRISETFLSRQGEGRLTGVESFFIRTSGCNLRCWFCDTPYASWHPEGERRTVDWLVEAAINSGARHVVVTGGEPLIAPAIADLTGQLREARLHVTIETAGTVDPSAPCDLLSLSPKLASSGPDTAKHPQWARRHEARRQPIEVMRRLIEAADQHQCKFVVQSLDQGPEILDLIEKLAIAAQDVWIMPEGITTAQLDEAANWLAPWTAANGFQYCDRMQIRWYGNRRGT